MKAHGQVIACLAWQSAPRHLQVRDRHLGWSGEARERNVHLLAYGTRFVILPWVEVERLASHILGRIAKLVPQDWQRLYAQRSLAGMVQHAVQFFHIHVHTFGLHVHSNSRKLRCKGNSDRNSLAPTGRWEPRAARPGIFKRIP